MATTVVERVTLTDVENHLNTVQTELDRSPILTFIDKLVETKGIIPIMGSIFKTNFVINLLNDGLVKDTRAASEYLVKQKIGEIWRFFGYVTKEDYNKTKAREKIETIRRGFAIVKEAITTKLKVVVNELWMLFDNFVGIMNDALLKSEESTADNQLVSSIIGEKHEDVMAAYRDFLNRFHIAIQESAKYSYNTLLKTLPPPNQLVRWNLFIEIYTSYISHYIQYENLQYPLELPIDLFGYLEKTKDFLHLENYELFGFPPTVKTFNLLHSAVKPPPPRLPPPPINPGISLSNSEKDPGVIVTPEAKLKAGTPIALFWSKYYPQALLSRYILPAPRYRTKEKDIPFKTKAIPVSGFFSNEISLSPLMNTPLVAILSLGVGLTDNRLVNLTVGTKDLVPNCKVSMINGSDPRIRLDLTKDVKVGTVLIIEPWTPTQHIIKNVPLFGRGDKPVPNKDYVEFIAKSGQTYKQPWQTILNNGVKTVYDQRLITELVGGGGLNKGQAFIMGESWTEFVKNLDANATLPKDTGIYSKATKSMFVSLKEDNFYSIDTKSNPPLIQYHLVEPRFNETQQVSVFVRRGVNGINLGNEAKTQIVQFPKTRLGGQTHVILPGTVLMELCGIFTPKHTTDNLPVKSTTTATTTTVITTLTPQVTSVVTQGVYSTFLNRRGEVKLVHPFISDASKMEIEELLLEKKNEFLENIDEREFVLETKQFTNLASQIRDYQEVGYANFKRRLEFLKIGEPNAKSSPFTANVGIENHKELLGSLKTAKDRAVQDGNAETSEFYRWSYELLKRPESPNAVVLEVISPLNKGSLRYYVVSTDYLIEGDELTIDHDKSYWFNKARLVSNQVKGYQKKSGYPQLVNFSTAVLNFAYVIESMNVSDEEYAMRLLYSGETMVKTLVKGLSASVDTLANLLASEIESHRTTLQELADYGTNEDDANTKTQPIILPKPKPGKQEPSIGTRFLTNENTAQRARAVTVVDPNELFA